MEEDQHGTFPPLEVEAWRAVIDSTSVGVLQEDPQLSVIGGKKGRHGIEDVVIQ